MSIFYASMLKTPLHLYSGLINFKGEVLTSSSFSGNRINLAIANIKSGMYLLKVEKERMNPIYKKLMIIK